MRKKGQALVEFVIILPVFLLLILGGIDIGKIIYFQNSLEYKLEDVIKLYNEDKTEEEIENVLEDIDLDIYSDDEYLTFELRKDLEIVTPGLNLVFKNPYQIKVRRVVFNEK